MTNRYPEIIYGERFAESTRHADQPCMVGHDEFNGGDWYFWPQDNGVYAPGFSDPYPDQVSAEKAALEWSNIENAQ